MSDLPADIIANILSRLAVRSVLRFKCVSKTWCALIDSPHFVKLHLRRSIQNNANLNLVFNRNDLYSSDVDSLNRLVKISHPFENPGSLALMGSCNGFLLLRHKEEGIAILNMTTEKYHKLPTDKPVPWPHDPQYVLYSTYGFGYDPLRNDYEVVRIVQLYQQDLDFFASEVQVYNLNSNSWRKVQDLPYYLCFDSEWGVFANGALHWLVQQRRGRDEQRLVVAFNLGAEEYSLLPQPEDLDWNCHMCLDVLGGCICVTCFYDMNKRIDLWVMKHYGVKESWTKLSLAKPGFRIRDYLKPLVYSKAGDEILFNCDGQKLLWYNLAKKTFKGVTFCGDWLVPYSRYVVVSVGSLVQHDGFGRMAGRKNVDITNSEDQMRKKRGMTLRWGDTTRAVRILKEKRKKND